jgi:hypothetical protein
VGRVGERDRRVGGAPPPGAAQQAHRERLAEHGPGQVGRHRAVALGHQRGDGAGVPDQEPDRAADQDDTPGGVATQHAADSLPRATRGEVRNREPAQDDQHEQGLDEGQQPQTHHPDGDHPPPGPSGPQVAHPRRHRGAEDRLQRQLVEGGGEPHRAWHDHRRAEVGREREEHAPAATEELEQHPDAGQVGQRDHHDQDQGGRVPVEGAGLGDDPHQQPAQRLEPSAVGLNEVVGRQPRGLRLADQRVVIAVEP